MCRLRVAVGQTTQIGSEQHFVSNCLAHPLSDLTVCSSGWPVRQHSTVSPSPLLSRSCCSKLTLPVLDLSLSLPSKTLGMLACLVSQLALSLLHILSSCTSPHARFAAAVGQKGIEPAKREREIILINAMLISARTRSGAAVQSERRMVITIIIILAFHPPTSTITPSRPCCSCTWSVSGDAVQWFSQTFVCSLSSVLRHRQVSAQSIIDILDWLPPPPPMHPKYSSLHSFIHSCAGQMLQRQRCAIEKAC